MKFPLFIGFTSAVRSGWVPPTPVADKRLRDPIKINEDLTRKQAAMLESAATCPLVAQLSSVYVMDFAGDTVLSAYPSNTLLSPGLQLIQCLAPEITQRWGQPMPMLYGFDVRSGLRMAALEFASLNREKQHTLVAQPVPLVLWRRYVHETPLADDPYEMLLQADERPLVSRTELMLQLGLGHRDASMDAKGLVVAARDIVICSGLFGV